MKNILKLSLISLCITTLFSCENKHNESYVGESYINFKLEEKKDSTVYTFAHNSDINESRVGLEVNIASDVVSYNRTYKVRFLKDESSAIEGTHFDKLEDNYIFKSNYSVDTMFINVKKSNDLSDKVVTAVFEIIDGGDFKAGLIKNRKARVMITNLLTRPTWWNEWHENNGLGTYSEKKYRLFISVTGEYNLDYENRDDMDYSKMRAYVMKFKYYLLENPTKDSDGNLMKVAMRG